MRQGTAVRELVILVSGECRVVRTVLVPDETKRCPSVSSKTTPRTSVSSSVTSCADVDRPTRPFAKDAHQQSVHQSPARPSLASPSKSASARGRLATLRQATARVIASNRVVARRGSAVRKLHLELPPRLYPGDVSGFGLQPVYGHALLPCSLLATTLVEVLTVSLAQLYEQDELLHHALAEQVKLHYEEMSAQT